jgi:hypothetical protein
VIVVGSVGDVEGVIESRLELGSGGEKEWWSSSGGGFILLERGVTERKCVKFQLWAAELH